MRRGLTAAGPRRPPSVRPPFFIFHRLTPAVPASSPPPGPALTPPHTQTVAYPTTQASNTRLPHDLLSGAQTNRPHTPPAAPPRAPTHTPAPGKSSGARPHTSASSPTCTSLRLPAHAPHPSFPSRHPATPEKTSPRIPPAASPRLPAPPSASPPRQAQKKRQPAKGCRASFKPPGDQLPLIWL